MKSDFELFLSQLTPTNATLGYFADFDKARRNVGKISIRLNQLNFLLGKEDLHKAILDVYEENPNSFEVLGILVAVRDASKQLTLNAEMREVVLNGYFSDVRKISEYIERTGLAEVFKNKDINSLVDYVFGVEVGMDSNSRKNRSGDNMVDAVSLVFEDAGIFYRKEISSSVFPEIVSLGVDKKRFDFVIKTENKAYLIEVNYYNSGGSKLNEVARSYSDIAPKINRYKNFEFIWITDGRGWLSAKKQLEEAYIAIPQVYNLFTLMGFVGKLKNECVIKNW